VKYAVDDTKTTEVLLGSGVARSHDKPHLTDVLRYIKKQLGTDYKGGSWGAPGLTAEIGFLWEETLSRVFGSRFAARLGEVIVDGIALSPDGFNYDEILACPVVEEYKATWKSSKNDPTDNWDWMVQTKAYCYALGVEATVFRILYMMGDYKGSGPLYRECRILYTDQELRDNWEMILNNRDAAWKEILRERGGV